VERIDVPSPVLVYVDEELASSLFSSSSRFAVASSDI